MDMNPPADAWLAFLHQLEARGIERRVVEAVRVFWRDVTDRLPSLHPPTAMAGPDANYLELAWDMPQKHLHVDVFAESAHWYFLDRESDSDELITGAPDALLTPELLERLAQFC